MNVARVAAVLLGPLCTACVQEGGHRKPVVEADSPLTQARGASTLSVTEAPDSMCGSAGQRSIRVLNDSVANLPLWAPLGLLMRMCPAARETSYVDYEGIMPAVEFPFPGFRAIAVQDTMYEDSTNGPMAGPLDRSRAASQWYLIGANAVLDGRVPFTAHWSDIRRILGPATGTDELGLLVQFCALPRFRVRLRGSGTGPVDWGKPATAIPDGATIELVTIGADNGYGADTPAAFCSASPN